MVRHLLKERIYICRYGLALRDHDIDMIRSRSGAVVNRYPLMDVSLDLSKPCSTLYVDSILQEKMCSVSY